MTGHEWRRRAACRELPPEWFMEVRAGYRKRALAICATCPVAAECLAFALRLNITHGV